MGYASAFISKHGKVCTIARTPSVTSKWTKRRTSNSTDPSTRDAAWQGLILSDSSLASGDISTDVDGSFLVHTTSPSMDALEWFGVKCNADVTLWRFVDDVNENGDTTQTPTPIASTKAWGQIVTARLRAADPGLLDSARYIFDLPKSLGTRTLDRIVYGARNFQVESIDDVAMAGVVRVQLGEDNR